MKKSTFFFEIRTDKNESLFSATLRDLSSSENCSKTKIPYLYVYRFTGKEISMPKYKNPYLWIVIDGSMRMHTPSGILDYLPGQYSVSAIDTPYSAQVLTLSTKNDFNR